MPKPRSVVGRLLSRIKGDKTPGVTSTPTPTPNPTAPPKGPLDPDKAMLLYTRLRDSGLLAARLQLTLGGQLASRRKAIVTELEADRYAQAERLLGAMDDDLKKEEAAAVQRLKDEFLPLRKSVLEIEQTPSTSPTVARLVNAAKELALDIENKAKARQPVAAAGQLGALESRVEAVRQQLVHEKGEFDKAFEQLTQDLAPLTSPVIAPEVRTIRTTHAQPARQKAEGGDPFGGTALAQAGSRECGVAAGLLQAYGQALAQANATVQTLLGSMFPLDSQRIRTDYIEAAELKATQGQREPALELLQKVAAECAKAKTTRDRSPFNASNTTQLASRMDQLLNHPHKAALTARIGVLNERYVRAKANQESALSKAAAALFKEIYWECERLSALADQHGLYVARRDNTVQPGVKALRTDGPAATVEALTAEIASVEALIDKAERQAAKHLYELAGDRLGEAQQAAARVAQLKLDHARYAGLRQQVADGLQGLPDLAGSALAGTLQRLTSALAQATAQGQTQRQFSAAAQALEALQTEVDDLVQGAQGRGEAVEASRDAQPVGADPQAIAASLEKLGQLLATLKTHAGQAGAAPQIENLEALLVKAEKAPALDAPALLAQAGEHYVQGIEHASQHGHLLVRIRDVVQPAKALLDAGLPAILALSGQVDEQVDQALKLSLEQDHAHAAQRLDAAMVLVAQARQLTQKIEDSGRRFTALKDTAVPALTTHTPAGEDPVIGAEIKALGLSLTLIGRLMTSRDYEAALTALDQAELNAQKASIKKKVSAGALTPEEMTEQCRQIVARPNGLAALDELVETFKSGQSVQAVLAAMKARFKLDDAECVQGTDDQGKVTQELCALYTSMTKVPEKHTRDNPSFKKIVRKPKGSGSSYSGGSKAINMSEGHPDTSSERKVAEVTELPDVEDDCKPAPNAPVVKFFDWNTWHEVGHAMDDRKRFMATHGSEAAYGGWIKHGGDILSVAQAVAEELNEPDITAQAIAAYLEAATAPSPVPAQWAKVTAWALAAGHGKIPWKAGGKCGASVRSGGLQAKGRIYHEGYAGDWYSYLPEARKQGITGYQFRAPGEWFSELYAAYKSDKLKDSHPARTMLDKLFAD